jgi:hypothetical protein
MSDDSHNTDGKREITIGSGANSLHLVPKTVNGAVIFCESDFKTNTDCCNALLVELEELGRENARLTLEGEFIEGDNATLRAQLVIAREALEYYSELIADQYDWGTIARKALNKIKS